jgi:hypothetical protein
VNEDKKGFYILKKGIYNDNLHKYAIARVDNADILKGYAIDYLPKDYQKAPDIPWVENEETLKAKANRINL